MLDKIEIIDNFIPLEVQTNIERILINNNYFQWYYRSNTVDYAEYTNESTQDAHVFEHTFILEDKQQSDWATVTNPILVTLQSKINFTSVFRVKANLTIKDKTYPENNHSVPHTDLYKNNPDLQISKVAIYYVNDSDGDTFFFDNELNVIHRQTPKKGTLALFDANIIHAASLSKDTAHRAVINFILKVENE